jgi:hypothetical protein
VLVVFVPRQCAGATKTNEVTVITKLLLLALLAACGVPSNTATIEPPPEQPPDVKPPDDPGLEDQHFCCQSVDFKTFSGDGCQLITELQVALCNKVLYCEGNWVKDDGKVACE